MNDKYLYFQNDNPHVQEELNRKGACPSSLGPLGSYDLEKLAKKHGAAGTDRWDIALITRYC